MSERSVAVIGGGLAGLAAAATAAGSGADVTMFEARPHEGGRARTTAVEGGFLFNQGPHALYAGCLGIEVLRGFGIEPRGKRPPLRGYGRLRGRLGLLPGTPVDLFRSKLVGTRSKLQLGLAVGSPKRLARHDARGKSMQQWIDEQVSDADARALFTMVTRVATYCADLDRFAADAAVPQVLSALSDGVLYLDGGWQQLVDSLRVAADRAGVKIVAGAKVSAVERTPSGSLRVVAADVPHDADAVVIAAGGPTHADELLAGASAAVRGWATSEQPIHAASLDLGMRALPVPERRVVFGVDDPLYLSVHTPSAALAPDGGEVLHVMRYGVTGTDDPGALRAEIEDLLDDAQPGWRDEVVAEHFNRNLVVAYGRPLPGVPRPTPRVPDLDGVFVAGDWVGPDGLLADAALASARTAGRSAAQVPSTAAASPATPATRARS
ncbi:MAG TPA: FAD-dependent oxidoreductase [Acidimicrobiia bacterium]|jgi:phytoene dehydrogenase-like protein